MLWLTTWLSWDSILSNNSFDNYRQTEKLVDIQAVALDTVSIPIVPPPQTYNDIFDQTFLFITPLQYQYMIYAYAACPLFGLWFLYGLTKYGNDEYTISTFSLMFSFTTLLAVLSVSITTNYIYVEPLRMQFREKGLPLKIMIVLKSGGSNAPHKTISIIQYEVDITNSTGMTDIVKVQACIVGKDTDSLHVLPMQPMSICAPGPPEHTTMSIYILLASPFGCISFYDWNESDSKHEKCVFAIITATLCMLGALCISRSALNVMDVMKGKSKSTIIVSDQNKMT